MLKLQSEERIASAKNAAMAKAQADRPVVKPSTNH
jgi:hypothetical protein